MPTTRHIYLPVLRVEISQAPARRDHNLSLRHQCSHKVCCIRTAYIQEAVLKRKLLTTQTRRSAVQLSVFSCSYRRCKGCSTLRRPQHGAAGPPSRRSPLLSMPTSWPLSPRRSGWPPRTHRCPPCGWFLRGRKGDRSANGPTSAQDPAERNSHHHCP